MVELIKFLLKKPGYLKKSLDFVNNTLKSEYTEDQFLQAKYNVRARLKGVKQVKKGYNPEEHILSPVEEVRNFREIKNTSFKSININKNNNTNVLIIGDTHFPFEKKGYLEHCLKVQKEYNCKSVVHIGDLVDNHAVSYHDKDPDGKSPGDEYKLALDTCDQWYRAFPEVKICIGNHDRLPFRKAFTAGLPKNWLKSYQEMFNSPSTWKWDFVHKLFGVIYQHGTGLSGEMASINCARENRQSTVIGHLHTVCNTRFLASEKDMIFGMSVGCGIDHTKYAFAYGKENTRKPVIACSVVLNGKMPINVPMNI